SAQAYQADRAINHSSEFIANVGTPFYVALQAPQSAGAAAAALADRTRRLAGVLAVAEPRYLGSDTWKIDLIAAQRPYSAATQNLVHALTGLGRGDRLFVGGDAASFRDERRAIAARLPVALALLAVATLIILFLLSGSLIAPLLALLMNALTLAAAFGALV